MYEFVALQHIVSLTAAVMIYSRHHGLGSMVMAVAGIKLIKDLNIQHFANVEYPALSGSYTTLLLAYGIIAASQAFLFIFGIGVGQWTRTYGRAVFDKLSTFKGPSPLKILVGTVAIFCLMASASNFGLLEWFNEPRRGYEEHRAGIGPFFMLYLTLIGLATVANMRHYCKNVPIFLTFLFFVTCLAFLSGNKSIVLETLLFSVGFIFLYRLNMRPITVVFLAVLAIGLYPLLVSHILSLMPSYLNVGTAYFDHARNSFFILESNYFDKYSLADYFYGVLIENVPRALWPSKPYFYGDGLLTKEIFDSDPGKNLGFLPPVWPYVSGGLVALLYFGFSEFNLLVLGVVFSWLSVGNGGTKSPAVSGLGGIELLLMAVFLVFTVPNILGLSGASGLRLMVGVLGVYVLVYVGGVNARPIPGK